MSSLTILCEAVGAEGEGKEVDTPSVLVVLSPTTARGFIKPLKHPKIHKNKKTQFYAAAVSRAHF